MDKGEFLRQEYLAFRAEVASTRARIHRAAWGSVLLLPAALWAASRPGAFPLPLAVPAAVAAASLLFLTEQMHLVRLCRYVKVHIEHGIEGVVGWEHWLGTRDPALPRNLDRQLAWLVQSPFVASYLASSALAVGALHERYSPAAPLLGGAAYAAGGCAYLWFLLRNLRHAESAGGEDTCLKALLIRPHCIFGPDSD